jgi:hypothetical protein
MRGSAGKPLIVSGLHTFRLHPPVIAGVASADEHHPAPCELWITPTRIISRQKTLPLARHPNRTEDRSDRLSCGIGAVRADCGRDFRKQTRHAGASHIAGSELPFSGCVSAYRDQRDVLWPTQAPRSRATYYTFRRATRAPCPSSKVCRSVHFFHPTGS